jgi:plasmid stabilization system protein ParE
MSRAVLSAAARLDRREITAATAERFGIQQARRLRDRFQAALQTLAESPLSGRTHEELDPPGRGFR